MPKSPLASLAVGRRAVSPLHWLLLLLLLGALSVVQARAGPDANPKAKAQSEVENYQDYSEYGEDIYGKILSEFFRHVYTFCFSIHFQQRLPCLW